MLLTDWLMYGLPEDDLWKTETCWLCNVSIIKPNIDIVHLVGYNTVYELMQRMKDDNKKMCNRWNIHKFQKHNTVQI